MSETLGKIEKPEANNFSNDRKLIFVPLVFLPFPGDAQLAEMVKSYWAEAEKQVRNLQSKLGPVSRIFHELVSQAENPNAVLSDMRFGSQPLVKGALENGGQFMVIEDPALLGEYMDWSRCLSVGLQSEPVFREVYQRYQSAYQRRNELLGKNIREFLPDKEVGLLFLTEEHHIQFAPDIQVFYVAPPQLDAIHRYLREKSQSGSGGKNSPEEKDKPAEKKEATHVSGKKPVKRRKNQAK